MKPQRTVTIYAHFSAQNTIDKSCLFNLKGLKEISDEIFFISTSKLTKIEIEKIKPYCSIIQCRENIGLDFGSYQFGLQFIDKNTVDYLILTNDSVLGPIYPLKETINKATNSDADVFGITLSSEIHPHLQSYFLIFKKQVIKSKAFNNFWNEVKLTKNKKDIIYDYEIGLSKTLKAADFKLDALYKCNLSKFRKILIFITNTENGYKIFRLKKLIYKIWMRKDLGFNPTIIYAEDLIYKYKIPYLKKELIEKKPLKLKLSTKLKLLAQYNKIKN